MPDFLNFYFDNSFLAVESCDLVVKVKEKSDCITFISSNNKNIIKQWHQFQILLSVSLFCFYYRQIRLKQVNLFFFVYITTSEFFQFNFDYI